MKLDSTQQAAQQQFDRRSGCYGAGHLLADVSDVELTVQGIPLSPSLRMLDIATGGGHTGLFFARKGMEVTFSDISKEMLTRVAKVVEEEKLQGQYHQHPAEELPYGDAVFDIVASRVAPHHFSDPQQFVREAARVLKPGGHFLMIDVASPEDEDMAEWINRVEKLRDPSHVWNHSRSVWLSWLQESGLRPLVAEQHPMKQADLVHYFNVADTSEENRRQVYAMIETASPKVRKTFGLAQEEGRVVWWWQRLRLLAQKPW